MKARRVASAVCTLALLGLAAALAKDDKAPPAAEPRSPDAVQDLVFLGDVRPVLIRLHVFLDGKPFRAVHRVAWDAYLQRLFRHLDRDGDGGLSPAEAERLPPPQLVLPGAAGAGSQPVNFAFNFLAVDGDGDGKASLAEVAEYYRSYGTGAFQAQFASNPVGNNTALGDALFSRLDRDKDGKLSRAELDAAVATLFELDADKDEILTPQELQPGVLRPAVPRAMMQQQPASGVAVPDSSAFAVVAPGEAAERLAQRLLTRYRPSEPSRDQKLTRTDIGLERTAFERLDANKDGMLDAQELLRFADRPADVEVTVRLGITAPGAAWLEVGHVADTVAVRKSGDDGLLLGIGKVRVELRRNRGRAVAVRGSRAAHLRMFKDADTNRDGFVDKQEARQGVFTPAVVALLDRDGDGKVSEQELTAYLDSVQEPQAAALADVTSLLISDEGRSLFDLLDRNRDGRLGLREVRALPQLLAELDADGDGQVARDELTPGYQLAMGLCQASFNRFAGNGGAWTPAGMPLLTLDWSGAGMVWFQKMDRNRDGDVSLREFLGPLDAFKRLDSDGDGLISLEEAEQAEKRLRK